MCCFVPAVAVSFFVRVCVPPVSPLWRINLMSNNPTVETSNLTSDTRLDLSSPAANANVITCTEQRCLGFKEPNMIPQFIRKKNTHLQILTWKHQSFVFRFNIFSGKWPLPQTKCWKRKKGHWCREMLWKHSNDSERIEKKTPTNCFMVSTYLN